MRSRMQFLSVRWCRLKRYPFKNRFIPTSGQSGS